MTLYNRKDVFKHDTEKREENRQTRSGPKHHKKSSLLRRCLKTVNDVDEVTLDGRLFHTREATTGKAWSPMVEWHVDGTTTVDVDADLNCRRESMSATHWQYMAEPSNADNGM